MEGAVCVVTPRLPDGLYGLPMHRTVAALLRESLGDTRASVMWLTTPMRFPTAQALGWDRLVYDCMDELASFRGAPDVLREREAALLRHADVVTTGGYSLWEAKRERHGNVHAFPSSVDIPHFAQARTTLPEPPDLRCVPHPRIGYYGVLDERLDLELVGQLAAKRPEWHFVLVGPVAKIEPSELPRGPNLHYPGQKPYEALPAYLAHWDVAMMPFARNEATRFISPTKTPEYLAAGVPVVSTGIRDVVRQYGASGAVHIAETADAFALAIEAALQQDRPSLQRAADRALQGLSWDSTWAEMDALLTPSVGPGRIKQGARRGP